MKGWIGYYYTISRRYGDHLDFVKSLGMNWAHMSIDETHELPETISVAERCQELGISASYSVAEILWNEGRPYQRFENWKERFDYQRPWFDAFLNRGVLHSLYVADEPTGNGIPAEHLHEVCEYIRTETPYPTMLVEESRRTARTLPVVDYYGLTHYTPWPFVEGHNVILQDERINCVVAQAFNEKPLPIPGQEQWLKLYRRISHREGATLALFTLRDYVQNGRAYMGSASVPTVLAEHSCWAAEITQ